MSAALVTGAGGFVGRSLCALLRARGWTVRATSRSERAGCERLDVCDARAVEEALEGADTVFHLAAHWALPFDALDESVRVNTLGAANVLAAAARRREPPAVVLMGSAAEYGAAQEPPFREEGPALPANAYGASKLAATQLALVSARRVPVTVVRPSVIYGPGAPEHQLVPSLLRAIAADGECQLNGGAQTRDLVHVEDVCAGLLAAAEGARGAARGKVCNLASGVEHSVLSVARRFLERAGRGRLALGPASERPGDLARLALSTERARALLGWSAELDLDAGIARCLEAEELSPRARS